ISITGTNLADTITFTGNTGFNGNVLVNSGNGNDVVTLNTGAAGITNGSVTVLTGLGNDVLNLAGAIGGSLAFADTAGKNDGNVTAATKVGGSASLVGLGTLTLTGALTVGGGLTITSSLTTGTPLVVTGA